MAQRWQASESEPDHDPYKQPHKRMTASRQLLAAHVAASGEKKTRRLPPPTLRQLIILDALNRCIQANEGRSPTFRELALFAECKSVRTVTEHIHSLRRKGLVVDLPREVRTLFLTNAGEKALKEWQRPKHVQHVKLV